MSREVSAPGLECWANDAGGGVGGGGGGVGVLQRRGGCVACETCIQRLVCGAEWSSKGSPGMRDGESDKERKKEGGWEGGRERAREWMVNGGEGFQATVEFRLSF